MNDDMEQFERRLCRQSLREIPKAWRAEILTAARETQAAHYASRMAHRSFLSTFKNQLSTFFWPHPQAWAGLAPVETVKSAPPSPEAMAELKKQQRMFAELVGASVAPDADRRKIFLPRPRSERTEILTA